MNTCSNDVVIVTYVVTLNEDPPRAAGLWTDCNFDHRPTERVRPVGITGDQLRDPLKFLCSLSAVIFE